MELFEIIVSIGFGSIVFILGLNRFTKKKSADSSLPAEEIGRLKQNNGELIQKNGELAQQAKNFETELTKQTQSNKELWAQNEKKENKLLTADEKISDYGQKISNFEAREEQRQKEHETALKRAENLQQSFEEEKKRIQRERDSEIQQEKETVDRIWSEHEQDSIAHMKQVCRKPDIGFPYYENTDLPASFNGKFKPDFMIELLGQYMVIDAKTNKRDSDRKLQGSLKDSAKTTAKKIKESGNENEIYKMVFFIVPSLGLSSLTQTAFFEQGISFYAISAENFEPIMAAFKRVSQLEKLESIDPQERENIVGLIAAMDSEMSFQNTINILLAARGIRTAQAKDQLSNEMKKQVDTQKQKMKIDNFKSAELKKFMNSPLEQIKQIQKLVKPAQAPINAEEVIEIQDALL